jgi:hypothetical protein
MKSGNGSAAPSPTRGVAQNIAELLHDIVVLAELQWQLLRCDARQSLAQMITPAIVLACAAVLLLSCIPLALVCIALFLAEGTDLSYAQSFSITLAIGMVVGGIVALVSAWMLRRSFVVLRRSPAPNVRTLPRRLAGLFAGRRYKSPTRSQSHGSSRRRQLSASRDL